MSSRSGPNQNATRREEDGLNPAVSRIHAHRGLVFKMKTFIFCGTDIFFIASKILDKLTLKLQ